MRASRKISSQAQRTSTINFQVLQTHVEEERQTYTYQSLQRNYPRVSKHSDTTDSNEWTKSDQFTSSRRKVNNFNRVKSVCFRSFPVIRTILNYQRSYVLQDLFSGLSEGFLHLPQSLAYSLLASLPMSSGLYTSIFPMVVYAILGSSQHTSMGTNSVVSLVIHDMVERELGLELDAHPNGTARYPLDTKQHQDEFKLAVAMASTWLCGLILLFMGVTKLGFLTNFMPSSFIGGFTCAAGVHILTSQVSKALHIKLPLLQGMGKVFKTYLHLLKHLSETNVSDVAITFLTVVTLISLNFINPKLKAKSGVYIPGNLLVVILGTGLSYALDLKRYLRIAIVGHVPDGFPMPEVIDLELIPNVVKDSVAIAFITFSLNISMALMMARVHHYNINPNRELIAYAMCNILSSPFYCHVSSNSPARTMILNNDNAKTVLHSVPACLLLFVIILKYGHLFEELPVAVLAGVVMVAVSSLLLQVTQLPRLWEVNRTDFIVWVVTFLAAAILDLIFGLIIGVAVSMFGVLFQSFWVKSCVMVKARRENVFLHGSDRRGTEDMREIRIFFFPAQLCYYNAAAFKKQLYKLVFDPSKVSELDYEYDEDEEELVLEEDAVRCVVIECSAITYVDTDGINTLKAVVLQYHSAGIQVLLARVLENVYNTLDRGGFFDVLPRDCVFYELKDAIYEEWQTRHGVSRLSLKLNNNSNDTLISARQSRLIH